MKKELAVFLDIDGCLLSPIGDVCRQYYDANSRIAEMVRSGQIGEGPSIRLCTGREKNVAEVLANFFGIVDTWLIVEGGVALFNPTTREVLINPAITKETKELFRRLETKNIPALLGQSDCLQKYLGYMILQVLEKKSGSHADIFTIRRTVRHALRRWIGQRKLKVNRYFNRCVSITPVGVSKGSAVEFLARIDNIDLSRSIAVGDSESDIPLFRKVGRIGCPINATPACKKFVKSRRGKVSLLPYTQGVVDIIEWYSGG